MLKAQRHRLMALLGVILLIGIVKKNAIMMIDFPLDAKRSLGLTSRDAIYQACLKRFRPIMMTTMARHGFHDRRRDCRRPRSVRGPMR